MLPKSKDVERDRQVSARIRRKLRGSVRDAANTGELDPSTVADSFYVRVTHNNDPGSIVVINHSPTKGSSRALGKRSLATEWRRL
jgi:hypothetical protein